MKRVFAILLAVLFVTIVLPLVIVFVAERTIDNSPPESTAAAEAAVQE